MSTEHPNHRGWQSWLLLFLSAAVAIGGLTWIWGFRDVQRQDKHIGTAMVLFISYALFLLWVLVGSRWRPRSRWSVIGASVAAGVFCASTLRITGVTGDLIPIVRWRWSHPAAPPLTPPTAPQVATTSTALTNSFPQFLGPTRNGIVEGVRLARDWTHSPPHELWRRAVGAAWSGFAIDGRRAITQEQRGGDEAVACYDVLTGDPLWVHTDKSRYSTTLAGEGPRATPTISSNRVFVMGACGTLSSLDLATGGSVWSHDTLLEFGASMPEWGVACSPLVTGDRVMATVGGSGHGIVAYDRETGKQLWASGRDKPHWCSPARLIIEGVPQIVVFSESVSAYDEQTGHVLWQWPWRSSFPHVSTPALVGTNRVLVSQGYGGGSELLEISHPNNHWKASRIWKSNRLKSKFADLIVYQDHVYGLDDGALVCLDLGNGEMKWKGERYGHGQILLVGDLLLLTAESGNIILAEPNPSAFRELARFKVFSSKTWNPPALAGDLLLVRNDHEAAALRLHLGEPLSPAAARSLERNQ